MLKRIKITIAIAVVWLAFIGQWIGSFLVAEYLYALGLPALIATLFCSQQAVFLHAPLSA